MIFSLCQLLALFPWSNPYLTFDLQYLCALKMAFLLRHHSLSHPCRSYPGISIIWEIPVRDYSQILLGFMDFSGEPHCCNVNLLLVSYRKIQLGIAILFLFFWVFVQYINLYNSNQGWRNIYAQYFITERISKRISSRRLMYRSRALWTAAWCFISLRTVFIYKDIRHYKDIIDTCM